MTSQFLSSTGTLVLALVTNHGAYLVADSRGTEVGTQPATDKAQKVFQCGPNTLLAIVGTLILRNEKRSLRRGLISSGVLDLTELLRCLCEGHEQEPEVNYIAGHTYLWMKRWWDFVKPDIRQVADVNDGLSLCVIPIIQVIAGEFVISEIRFACSEDGNLPLPTVRVKFEQRSQRNPPDAAFTWGQHPDLKGIDFKPQTTEAAVECIRTLFARASVEHPKTVGGPTDIGLLDANGACWISLKESFNEPPVNE